MPKHHQYLMILYYAACNMAMVIYGDIVPYSNIEQVAGLMIMVFIKFFTSFIYAEFENYNSSINSSYTNHIQKLSAISNWMRLNQMPKRLINRVMKYEDLLWKTFKGNEVKSILEDLPETL